MKIGLDIGGSHIAIGIVNDKYELLLKEEQDIKISEARNPEQTLQNTINMLIDNVINQVGLQNIELIGLACPRKYK